MKYLLKMINNSDKSVTQLIFERCNEAMEFGITAMNTAVDDIEVEISIIKEDK